jgi:fermentation-respiration switch protein FrsA (DUF1100 family)
VTNTAHKRFVMLVLAALALAYALIVLGVYAGQRRLIYPARGVGAVPELAEATLEKLAGANGRTVHVLYSQARDGAPTVVHFHGNGEELADLVDFVTLLRLRGLGVLAVEYPGYGLSKPGAPTESGIYEDAESALRDLRENKRVSRENTVLSGQSLGSGVAVEMAQRGYGARVVLYSPYTSIADVANVYLPFLPNRLLVRDTFDSKSKAPDVDVPVLIVHGTHDEVIPFALGSELSGCFRNARLVPVEQGRHNDLFVRGGDTLVDEVAKFCRGLE